MWGKISFNLREQFYDKEAAYVHYKLIEFRFGRYLDLAQMRIIDSQQSKSGDGGGKVSISKSSDNVVKATSAGGADADGSGGSTNTSPLLTFDNANANSPDDVIALG